MTSGLLSSYLDINFQKKRSLEHRDIYIKENFILLEPEDEALRKEYEHLIDWKCERRIDKNLKDSISFVHPELLI